VAKKGIFETPFFGRVLRRAGFVSVDRTARRETRAALYRAVASALIEAAAPLARLLGRFPVALLVPAA